MCACVFYGWVWVWVWWVGGWSLDRSEQLAGGPFDPGVDAPRAPGAYAKCLPKRTLWVTLVFPAAVCIVCCFFVVGVGRCVRRRGFRQMSANKGPNNAGLISTRSIHVSRAFSCWYFSTRMLVVGCRLLFAPRPGEPPCCRLRARLPLAWLRGLHAVC